MPKLTILSSQGSAVTHLRCGGQCNNSLVANLLPNSTVKKFENRLIFARVMDRRTEVPFFDSQCTWSSGDAPPSKQVRKVPWTWKGVHTTVVPVLNKADHFGLAGGGGVHTHPSHPLATGLLYNFFWTDKQTDIKTQSPSRQTDRDKSITSFLVWR